MMISGVVAAFLADVFGRRLCLLASTLLVAISSAMSGSAPNYLLLCISIFMAGASISFYEVLSLLYASETCGRFFRSDFIQGLMASKALAEIFLAFMYPLVSYWRYIFLFDGGLPFLILFFASIHILDESVKYLTHNGMIEETKKILKKMAKVNGCPPFKFKLVQELEEENDNCFYLDKKTEFGLQSPNASFFHSSPRTSVRKRRLLDSFKKEALNKVLEDNKKIFQT